METDLRQTCEECGVKLSPQQAEDSYHTTYEIGEGGRVLCAKHLDQHKRGVL